MANLKDLIVNGSARVIGKLFAQTPASNTNNNEVATTSFVCNVGDGKSVSKSSNNKLQAVGVLDVGNTSTALKSWTGTRSQYDAIATKDNNTLYHITDDMDVTLTLLNTLYPVGAIYIGTCASCPLQVLGVGNWTLKASDMVLQGSGIRTAKETVEAGLPNIKGTAQFGDSNNGGSGVSTTGGSSLHKDSDGPWYRDTDWASGKSIRADNTTDDGAYTYGIGFDASLSNPIYGNSDTVQPPAYIVNIWERIN